MGSYSFGFKSPNSRLHQTRWQFRNRNVTLASPYGFVSLISGQPFHYPCASAVTTLARVHRETCQAPRWILHSRRNLHLRLRSRQISRTAFPPSTSSPTSQLPSPSSTSAVAAVPIYLVSVFFSNEIPFVSLPRRHRRTLRRHHFRPRLLEVSPPRFLLLLGPPPHQTSSLHLGLLLQFQTRVAFCWSNLKRGHNLFLRVTGLLFFFFLGAREVHFVAIGQVAFALF